LKNIKLEISFTDQLKRLMKEFSEQHFETLNTFVLDFIPLNDTHCIPEL